MRKVLVSAVFLSLAACGGGDSGTVQTEDGEVAYDVNQSGDDVNATITGPDGEVVNIASGAGADVTLPDGFSIYPGAANVSSTSVTSGDGGGALVMMTSADTPEKIIGYYRKQAEAAGVVINATAATNGTQVIGGESADGLAFTLSASPDGQGQTMVQMSVGRDE